MTKTTIFYAVTLLTFIGIAVAIFTLHQSIQVNNAQLTAQIEMLNNKVDRLSNRNEQLTQQLALVEKKLTPRYQDLLSMNNN